MIIYIIMKVTFQIVWNTTYDSSERNQEVRRLANTNQWAQ
jgi:hypothetical protein